MPKFIVKADQLLFHDGKKYGPYELVDLTQEQADGMPWAVEGKAAPSKDFKDDAKK